LGAEVTGDLARDDWDAIEARFRVWSFGVLYQRTFAEERDPNVRFVKALLASTRPIRDRDRVIEWHRKRRRKRRSSSGPTK